MADEEDDDSQKTEDPTQRRLDEAFKKGQGVNSREVTNFLLILVLTVSISWLMPTIMGKSSVNLSHFIEHAHEIEAEQGNLGKIMIRAFGTNFILILMPMLMIIVAVIFSSFMQNQGRFMVSEEIVKFDFSRISMLKGIKRLFSKNSLVEFIKSLVKLLVVGVVCYLSIMSEINSIRNIHEQSIMSILGLLVTLLGNMMISVCVIMAIIAALDYLFQHYSFMQQMRMSKFELKEEYKQTEGSPEIKGRLRKIRAQRARQRMMSAVPKADVIITNPTHFSVALKYDEGSMRAPVVVAKGRDNIALKIREIAKDNKIPIVENPPLARTLYKEVEIDQEINITHYKAVAEIISYIYGLKNK